MNQDFISHKRTLSVITLTQKTKKLKINSNEVNINCKCMNQKLCLIFLIEKFIFNAA